MFKSNGKIGRRDLFKTSAGIMGGALLSREAAAEQPAERNVNTNSSPSALKITDLVTPLRMNEGQEATGMDLSLHGEEGYNFEG